MKFILTAGWEDGVASLTERLVRELANGQKVLWIVSGGSNIPASVQVMGNIPANLKPKLSVMLADERYGEAGHQDSNWEQLMKSGFSAGQATLLPVLRAGLGFGPTISRYEKLAGQALKDNQTIIAQLGIGEDSHVAGILPGSAAAAEAKALVAGYQSQPFKRLTLTFPALRKASAAYAFAFGNTKHKALADLQAGPAAPGQQPAQVLKQLPEAYVYSDQVRGSS